MVNRGKYEEYITGKLGPAEKPLALSSATLDMTGQIPVQGYVALTTGYLIFLQESGLGEIQIQAFARNQMAYRGTTYGLIGKTYLFEVGGSEVKIGGVELPFEQIIEKNFTFTTAPAPQIQSPTLPMPPPATSLPPPSPTLPPPLPPQVVPPPLPRRPAASSSPAPFTPMPARDDLQYVPTRGGRGPALAAVIMMVIVFMLGIVAYTFFSIMNRKVIETAPKPATPLPPSEEQSSAPPTSASEGAPRAALIVMVSPSGKEIINIHKKEAGNYKVLVDGATYKGKIEEEKLKIKNASGATMFKVKAKEGGGFKITDDSDHLIAKVKPEGAGFKVSDDSATLAKIKAKGDGFAVTDGSGAAIGSVVPDGNNWKALDASGEILFTVRGSQGKTVTLALALKTNPVVQAAVLLYLNEF